MKAEFIQEGCAIDFTPTVDTPAGSVIVENGFVCITKIDIEANRKGAKHPHGIYKVEKVDGVAFALGAGVYFDEDANPKGGVAGSGAAVADSSLGAFMGNAIIAAEAGDTHVYVWVRSMEAAAANTLALADLSNVGVDTATAGNLMIADGDSWESKAASGDVTVAASGAMTVNAAIKEKEVLIPIAALGANGDLAALTVFGVPRAATLVSVGYLSGGDGDFGVIDDANTSVFALTDGAGNAIVSKTFNTATQPTANALNDLGALSAEHKVLTAAEICKLAITNGATAKTPAGFLVIRYLSTNA